MPFSSQVQRSLNHITDGIRRMPERSGFIIKEVIFNDPVTVVNWADGKKTIVRCQEGDTYDKRTRPPALHRQARVRQQGPIQRRSEQVVPRG